MLTREEEAGKVWVGLELGYRINQSGGLKNRQFFFVYSFSDAWTFALPQVLHKDSEHLKACFLNFKLNLQKKIVRFQKRPI